MSEKEKKIEEDNLDESKEKDNLEEESEEKETFKSIINNIIFKY